MVGGRHTSPRYAVLGARFWKCHPPRNRLLTSPRNAKPSQTQPNPNTFPVGATATQTRVVAGKNMKPRTGTQAISKADCHRAVSRSHHKRIAALVLKNNTSMKRHPTAHQPTHSDTAAFDPFYEMMPGTGQDSRP